VGSFGTVDLCEKMSGEEVAVKMIDISGMYDEIIEGAMKEVDFLKKLISPFIIQYKEHFIDDE
jgi:hypothetical protein